MANDLTLPPSFVQSLFLPLNRSALLAAIDELSLFQLVILWALLSLCIGFHSKGLCRLWAFQPNNASHASLQL